MVISEFIIDIEETVKFCTEELIKDSIYIDATIKRYKVKSNNNFDTIWFCNSAVIRIRQLNNEIIIEIAKRYVDLFDLQNEVKYTMHENNWGKLILNENISQKILQNTRAVFRQCYLEEQVDKFGCCSRYEECSDAKKCIHPDIKFAQGCIYKGNLEKGKIFYGNNRNV